MADVPGAAAYVTVSYDSAAAGSPLRARPLNMAGFRNGRRAHMGAPLGDAEDAAGIIAADNEHTLEQLVLVAGATDPELRSLRLKMAVATQWIFVIVFSALLTVCILIFPPWDPKLAKCDDAFQLYWAPVWAILMLLHMSLILAVSHLRLAGHRIPTALFHIQRVVRSTNTIWFFYGVKPLFWSPACPAGAGLVQFSRVLWWVQATFYLIPLFFYLMFCLCLPCIIIFLNRVRALTPNETPTPDWILSKLQVTKYKDLLNLLKPELGGGPHTSQNGTGRTPGAPPPGPARLTDAISRYPLVEAFASAAQSAAVPLMGSATGGQANVEGRSGDGGNSDSDHVPLLPRLSSRLGAPVGSGNGPPKLEKSCPICMAEFEPVDDVMLMPCDKRHFFHVDCVKEWLRGSQFCPICRANVVSLVSNAENQTSPSTNNPEVATIVSPRQRPTTPPEEISTADPDDLGRTSTANREVGGQQLLSPLGSVTPRRWPAASPLEDSTSKSSSITAAEALPGWDATAASSASACSQGLLSVPAEPGHNVIELTSVPESPNVTTDSYCVEHHRPGEV